MEKKSFQKEQQKDKKSFLPQIKPQPSERVQRATVKDLVELQNLYKKQMEGSPKVASSQEGSLELSHRQKESQHQEKQQKVRKLSPIKVKPGHINAMQPELLAAGADPLARVQDFSLHMNQPANLMAQIFKKPPHINTRFPPILDTFSRTMAAPISTLKVYLSPSTRIASYYSQNARGILIDPNTRLIKFIQLVENSLPANTDPRIDQQLSNSMEFSINKTLREPELQQLDYNYKRYRKYIENEIDAGVIAPFRQYWISHILELIPADLHLIQKERVEEMIDDMLTEVNTDYYEAGKKSILDYVLKSENEKIRLGIKFNPHPPVDYGDAEFKGIPVNEEWKTNVMMARMLMSDNLSICCQATLQLNKLWEEFRTDLFYDLPQYDETLTLEQFKNKQRDQMQKVKNKLMGDWNRKAVEIIREELGNLDKEQAMTFFDAVSCLMSNQVRQLITDSLMNYLNFFRRFKRKQYPTPEQAIVAQKESWPDVFLKLSLVDQDNQVTFSHPLSNISTQCLELIDELVAQSKNLPRPENTIARSEKTHLWEVPIDDEVVRDAYQEIKEILNQNIDALKDVPRLYKGYLYLLSEKQRAEK